MRLDADHPSGTHHVNLVNRTAIRYHYSTFKDAIHLLHPRPISSKMVEDIPIFADSSTTLASALRSQSHPLYVNDMSILVPPTRPTRRIRRGCIVARERAWAMAFRGKEWQLES